jgi:hypothetical protein
LNQIGRIAKLALALVLLAADLPSLQAGIPCSGNYPVASLVQYNVVSTDGAPNIVFYILTPAWFGRKVA